MDLFGNTAAILNSIVQTAIMVLKRQISMCLSTEHPVIDIWNNRTQNGRRNAEKVDLLIRNHIRASNGVLNEEIDGVISRF